MAKRMAPQRSNSPLMKPHSNSQESDFDFLIRNNFHKYQSPKNAGFFLLYKKKNLIMLKKVNEKKSWIRPLTWICTKNVMCSYFGQCTLHPSITPPGLKWYFLQTLNWLWMLAMNVNHPLWIVFLAMLLWVPHSWLYRAGCWRKQELYEKKKNRKRIQRPHETWLLLTIIFHEE